MASTPAHQRALLIIDDEVAYLNFLGDLLSENLNCPVILHTRTETALAAIKELQPGLIVTDFYMPRIDGLSFVRQARVLCPGTPFILISGHATELSSLDLSALPEIRDILQKPFRWQILAKAVIKHWPADVDRPMLATQTEIQVP